MVDYILRKPNALVLMESTDGIFFSSRLGRVETIRTINKFNSESIEDAYDFLDYVTLIEIGPKILRRVESYTREITLKTSDAIHFATAEQILSDGDFLITMDKQMIAHAAHMNFGVLTFS